MFLFFPGWLVTSLFILDMLLANGCVVPSFCIFCNLLAISKETIENVENIGLLHVQTSAF